MKNLLQASVGISLGVVLSAGPATAGSEDFHAWGGGAISCQEWVVDFGNAIAKPANILQESQWVFGFLSGVGYAQSPDYDPLQGFGGNAVIQWITSYCTTHPTLHVMDAAEAFVWANPKGRR